MGSHFLNAVPALTWLLSPCKALDIRSEVDLRSLLTSGQNLWHPNTTFEFPSDGQSFLDGTERWTIFKPPTYSGVISVGNEEDVVAAVQLAVTHNVSFLATGGRHGYGTTLGGLFGGLEIDLGQLKSVVVDKSAATLTVGVGTTFADILDPAFEAGFQPPTGSCSCPGMVGVTLGAGVGRSSGVFGLVMDSLISVRVVFSTGEHIEVSETKHPSLFWAIRGAGANFGIVTSATYRLHNQSNNGQVVNVDFIFPAAMATAYFDALQSYNDNLPALHLPPSSHIMSLYRMWAQMFANWVYLGTEQKAREVLAPLFNLKPPITSLSVVPWSKILAVDGFQIDPLLCQRGIIRDLYSANVRVPSSSTYQDTFIKMQSFYRQYSSAVESVIQVEVYPNQKTKSIPSDTTAYPWRDAQETCKE
ncbi:hypothetical protein F5Y18DRAFT_431433 [Xylariaceae sp. FL1019]|nr:hypothetical protein F5Y18DRAFT_431433 [Xylariaceae sp. FL1019]